MEILRSSKEIELNGSVIAIGAFDGIHKGHQTVIKETVEYAKQFNVSSVIYTFDPPPRHFFQNAKILTDLTEKTKRVSQLGIDKMIIATFDDTYIRTSAQSFINELIRLNPKKIIVGEDFRFGNRRTGDIHLLKEYFNVETIKPVCCSNGERISSTRIRKLIIEGKNDLVEPLFS